MWGGLTLKKNSSESACNSSDAKALVFIDQAFGPSISAVITSNFPPLIPITGVIVQKQSDSTGFRRALQVIPRTDIHFWEWTPSLNQASTPCLHTRTDMGGMISAALGWTLLVHEVLLSTEWAIDLALQLTDAWMEKPVIGWGGRATGKAGLCLSIR